MVSKPAAALASGLVQSSPCTMAMPTPRPVDPEPRTPPSCPEGTSRLMTESHRRVSYLGRVCFESVNAQPPWDHPSNSTQGPSSPLLSAHSPPAALLCGIQRWEEVLCWPVPCPVVSSASYLTHAPVPTLLLPWRLETVVRTNRYRLDQNHSMCQY